MGVEFAGAAGLIPRRSNIYISVYFDCPTDGSYELTHYVPGDNITKKPDISGYVLGIDYPINRFKFSLEYIMTEADVSAAEKDLSSCKIKGGFEFADNGRRAWYLTFSRIDNDYQAATIKSSANLIGLDYTRNFTEKVSLDSSFAYQISSEFEESGVKADDSIVYLYKIKLNYLVSDNIGFSLGYRCITNWAEYTGSHVTIDDYLTAMTLGMFCKF